MGPLCHWLLGGYIAQVPGSASFWTQIKSPAPLPSFSGALHSSLPLGSCRGDPDPLSAGAEDVCGRRLGGGRKVGASAVRVREAGRPVLLLVVAMAFSVLPSLRPGDWRAVICVRVCRKWEYRGGSDDGPIQHVDLVLVDEHGNSLYAEIPGPEVEAKSPQIQENGIYVIGRFRVSNAKSSYRAVDAPYMVEFTLHTTISAARTDLPDFPKYAYKITPIAELPAYAGDTTNFLDTIGTLVEVSDVQPVHMPNKPPTVSRHIVLRDLSYSEMKITLWGQRATAFNTEGVYNRDQANPIVVLFVGGLMKSYQGRYYLSGNAACRWYFNPTIPEARPLYDSNHNQRLEIRSVASPVQQGVQNRASAQLEEKTLFEMNKINPYDFSEDGYRCTVTIGRLVPGATWWFPSCNKCSKSCVPDGTGYKCIPCGSASFKFKYKVCFTALDGTDEAEMVCFGDIARRIIGKPVQQLLRTSAGHAAYPADITKLVSLRFTFAVTMSRQSFYKAKKTYNVAALVTAHGHPAAAPGNGGHGQPAAAQYDDSSSDGGSQDALQQSTPTKSASTLSSPSLSDTPPPNVDALETPGSNKRKRGGRTRSGKTPPSRRKLVMPHDNAVTDTTTNAPGSSTVDAEDEGSDGDRYSPGHSPTTVDN